MDIKLKHLSEDVDRHGNVRLYVRKKVNGRFKRVRLRHLPGSPNFLNEYQAALESLCAAPKAQVQAQQVGTLGWLADQWHKSPQFTSTDKRQQRVRQLVMRSLLDETTKPGSSLRFFDCPIASFSGDHVRMLRNRKQTSPSTANKRVAELRKMFDWALEERSRWVKKNVARDVKPLKYEKAGFRPWTREDVTQFEAKWEIGTMPRLALAIMLFTGVRRSDAVRLGSTMANDGKLAFTPQKTKLSKKSLVLPILPMLQNVVDKTPTGIKTWLVTSHGKPFTANGFGNWFRERCNEAGLPECTSHGIRKIAAQTAAANGATEKELMDIFGWLTPDLAALYTREANQEKIAGGAMHKMVPTGP